MVDERVIGSVFTFLRVVKVNLSHSFYLYAVLVLPLQKETFNVLDELQIYNIIQLLVGTIIIMS